MVDAVRARHPGLHAAVAADLGLGLGRPGGIEAEASVRMASAAAEHGVDLVDVSSGGAVAYQQIPVGPGYQTGFSARIRRETGVKTGTVGLLDLGRAG